MDDQALNKSQKLVRILQLLQRRGGVGVQELMGRFALDSRTLRRYVADLREMGMPVGEEGGGSDRAILLDRSYARAGVQLSLAEVLSLHFGRTLFTFLDGTSFAAEMDEAIERLEPAISRATADLAAHLDRKFVAVPEHAKDYRDDPELLDEIVSALLYGNPADAEYRSPRGVGKVYRLEPLTLAVYRQGLYLFARDVAEGKVKSFAVERFVRFSRLRRERFTWPEDYDPQALFADSFGITKGQPVDVRVVFTPEAAPYVRERRWHASQRAEVLPDGGLRLSLRVANTPELREWLLGFGPDARVEAPQELVDWIRAQLVAAAARYG